jgi:hypothetical protein
MATYKVQDRSGRTFEVTGKEQADQWTNLDGYSLVDEAKPRKTAAKKSSAKSDDR